MIWSLFMNNPYNAPESFPGNEPDFTNATQEWKADSLFVLVGPALIIFSLISVFIFAGAPPEEAVFPIKRTLAQFGAPVLFAVMGVIAVHNLGKPALVLTPDGFQANRINTVEFIHFMTLENFNSPDGLDLSYRDATDEYKNVNIFLLKPSTRREAVKAIMSAYQAYKKREAEEDA